ncbi:MAG: hypothetical protein EPN20_06840 [Magnetospirillum sp.]|nr:MAG: hypothetical protein EPN20_06840 [Magnetospirillum sp.]
MTRLVFHDHLETGALRWLNGSFRLIGFGTFAKAERPARQGRNPKTGETIDIAASTSIKFSTAAALKKSL